MMTIVDSSIPYPVRLACANFPPRCKEQTENRALLRLSGARFEHFKGDTNSER